MKLPPKKLEELGSQGWVSADDESPAYSRIAEQRLRRGLPPPEEEEQPAVPPEPEKQGEDAVQPDPVEDAEE